MAAPFQAAVAYTKSAGRCFTAFQEQHTFYSKGAWHAVLTVKTQYSIQQSEVYNAWRASTQFWVIALMCCRCCVRAPAFRGYRQLVGSSIPKFSELCLWADGGLSRYRLCLETIYMLRSCHPGMVVSGLQPETPKCEKLHIDFGEERACFWTIVPLFASMTLRCAHCCTKKLKMVAGMLHFWPILVSANQCSIQ